MPVLTTYPGVYIEEIPSGVRTITGVATSITAFIGRAARGPVNESVSINSFAEFERIFGGLQEQFLMSYAVRDFYSNGGSQAIIVRLIHPNFATDADFLSAFAAAQNVTDAATNAALVAGATANDVKTAADTANTNIQNSAASPGAKTAAQTVATAVDNAVTAGATLDDVKTATASALAAAQSVATAATNAGSVPGATVNDVKTAADAANTAIQTGSASQPVKDAAQAIADAVDTAAAVAGATVDDVTAAATAAVAAAKTVADAAIGAGSATDAKTAADNANTNIQSGTASAQTKAAAQKIADAVSAAVTTGATLDDVVAAAKRALADAVPSSARLQLPTSGADFLVLEAANEGSWGNNLRARVDYDDLDNVGDRFAPLTAGDLFNLTIRDMNAGVTERFLSVTVKDSPRGVDRMLENGSNLARVRDALPASRPKETDDQTPPLTDADKKIVPFSNDDTPGKRSVAVAADDQGSDGTELDRNDFTGPNLQDNKRGLYALEKADLFNLLCIPPQDRGGNTVKEIYQDALPYCNQRRAMLIVDSPAEWSQNPEQAAANAKAGLSDLNLAGEQARNAALFFPRVIQPDPLRNGQLDTFVPCGIIAGVMARTDGTRGVWKAPAGIDAALNGIQALEVNLTDAENGTLNPVGINCLRFFPVAGRVVWGSRTLRGADQLGDEYKYIPVRRLALFLEETLYRSTQWVVFEPNDEPLWSQIRLNIGAFMHDLFRQGAFQGDTPQKAYFVKCDSETTTPTDIDHGIVNILVGFAPLKPAEFVVIKIQQIAGQLAT
jgi:phage tail sheath protein FI